MHVTDSDFNCAARGRDISCAVSHSLTYKKQLTLAPDPNGLPLSQGEVADQPQSKAKPKSKTQVRDEEG